MTYDDYMKSLLKIDKNPFYTQIPNQQDGIPIDASHNPLMPTLVVASSFRDCDMFCRACEINPKNSKIQPITFDHGHADFRGFSGNIDMAFLGCDPRYDNNMRDAGWVVEGLRQRGKINQVYIYPEIYPSSIRPNIIKEEGREWLGSSSAMTAATCMYGI